MAEAYVLAGELGACENDHEKAFARYQQRMMPFIRHKQKSAARFAASFVPKNAVGVRFRNVVTKLFGIPFVAEYVIGRDLRDDIRLPDYGGAQL